MSKLSSIEWARTHFEKAQPIILDAAIRAEWGRSGGRHYPAMHYDEWNRGDKWPLTPGHRWNAFARKLMLMAWAPYPWTVANRGHYVGPVWKAGGYGPNPSNWAVEFGFLHRWHER